MSFEHLTLNLSDARAERARLEQAAATLFPEEPPSDSPLLIMMLDPRDVPPQIGPRTSPFPRP